MSADIQQFQQTLATAVPLFKNRYKVTLPIGGQNMSMFATMIDVPALDYTTTQVDVGGHEQGVPVKWVPSEMTITFYNTGEEYKAINAHGDKLYNQTTRAFAYYDDVAIDIKIEEFDVSGNVKQTIEYTKCMLRGISGLQLSYEEATSIETFTATFSFVSRFVK